MQSAAAPWSKEWRSISATVRMVASGLALSCPAMSGALPCTGSYMPTLPPRLADGSMPMEPVSMAASSLRMSPNMLVVTMTSNCRGSRMSCMAQLSTSTCSSSTSP